MVVVALITSACGGSGPDATTPSSSPGPTAITGTVQVFAAASLKESFDAIAARFEKAHPGVTVRASYGPSSDLSASVAKGAPADVFAAASTTTMKVAQDANTVGRPAVFARNTMEVAVYPKRSDAVRSLADLDNPGVSVALCAPKVPCGVVAKTVLDKAKLTVTPKTYGVDVKAVLHDVSLGEVDAGIVYTTDVKAAGSSVVGVPIPAAGNATTDYPIATVAAGKNPPAAQAFVDAVRSSAGMATLAQAGFEKP